VDLETKLNTEVASEERKQRQLQTLGRKETDFLKLRRTRLTLTDFNTIKVIGKGAFGEVNVGPNLKPSPAPPPFCYNI
jgi:protein-serine/threonine kinase